MGKSDVASYYFVSWATGELPLLGGVRRHQSSRWGTPAEARLAMEGHLEVNRSDGRPCQGSVQRSSLPPEVFAHCDGSPPQAVGGRCFKCSRKLTREAAREVGERAAAEARRLR